MRNLARIAAIGGIGVAAVIAGKKIKQAQDAKKRKGALPNERMDRADESLFEPGNERA